MSNGRRRVEHSAPLDGYEHGADAPLRATATALARARGASSIVLVEGISDQIAVETLARRMGRPLDGDGVVVVPIGGAHAVTQTVAAFERRPGVRLTGLCDMGERSYFADVLDHYFVCDADLEDELIRAHDRSELLAILDAEGDLGAFRTLQKQAAWRDRPFVEQMHRWLRSVARRNLRYAQLLVHHAPDDRLPPPLVGLVEHV